MPYLVLIAAILFAAAPAFSPGFGGYEPDQYPVPQVSPPGQPAGYAFAIWGLIYAWLVVSAAFGVIARREAADWSPMRGPLFVSLAAGVPWLTVATMSPEWATALIWLMWLGAVLALLRAPARDMWMASVPTGLYAGWLTAASCVSVALLLGGYGVMSPTAAGLVGVMLALVLTLAILSAGARPYGFGAAVIWALIAISVQNRGDGSDAVFWLAAIGAIVILGFGAMRARRT